MSISKTPDPPYYAVIFSSILNKAVPEYEETAQRMVELASGQPGFLGVESARQEIGITVSYWKDKASIKNWKYHAEHTIAREKGKTEWYKSYRLRICKVETEYGKD